LERRGGDGSEDADGARTAQAPMRPEMGIAMGARVLGFWFSVSVFPRPFCRRFSARCGDLNWEGNFFGSGSSAFALSSRLFFIVWLRYVKIYNTVVNTVHNTILKLRSQIHGTVVLDRSESSNLDRMAERGSNSQHCSYSAQMQRSKSIFHTLVFLLIIFYKF
jgi:hypothetical protein